MIVSKTVTHNHFTSYILLLIFRYVRIAEDCLVPILRFTARDGYIFREIGIVCPPLNYISSAKLTEKIIPNNSIQKSVEFFVACRVKSSLILLYTILSYFINISFSTFLQLQRTINMIFAILYSFNGWCYD